jgi:farnesyl diphosphate synthase
MATTTSREAFEAVFPMLAEDLLAHAKKYNLPENAVKWFEQVLNVNVPGGKLNRGLSVPDTGLALLQKPLTDEQFKHLSILGWLTELLQAFFLVSDDMMDGSITRRGQPCWYRHPGVGMIAINDAFMLESGIYVILKKHFRSHPAYVDLLELFHETTWQTELGQLCDLITAPEDKVDLDNFSMEKYMFIVTYKTAYYSFYLPVALALLYLELATPENLQQTHDILIPLGQYFQVQDDYLDAYGDPAVIGKIGTDIQDNKCSWLINQALQRCNTEQRKLLDTAYGRKDGELEAKVKALYKELDLEKVYKEYEEKTVGEIRTKIAAIDESQGLKKEVFEAFLGKIYKRTK